MVIDQSVSVIIPVYNRADILRRPLESLRRQTQQPDEVVIVDDGSTDDLGPVLAEFADLPLRLIRQANQGAAAARNTGILAARGTFIALLDSDDEWLPDKLALQTQFMAAQGPDVRVTTTGFYLTRAGEPPAQRRPADQVELLDFLWVCPVGPGTTLMARRDQFTETGLFDTDLKRLEDWDWLIRYQASGVLRIVPDILAIVHRGAPPKPAPVIESAGRLWEKHRRSLPFLARRRLAGALAYERAAVFLGAGRRVAGALCLLQAFVRAPGPVLGMIQGRLRERRGLIQEPRTRQRLIFVVTEDWYFWAHRLALGRAALAAGYDVTVVARVQDHGDRIREAGFTLVALPWRRSGSTIGAELCALWALWRLFLRDKPDIVHAIALKPIIYAGLIARIAGVKRRLATVAGLGYVYTSNRLKARWLRPLVSLAIGLGLGGRQSRVLLENAEDGEVLIRIGALARPQIALICGCGVDIGYFKPRDRGGPPPEIPVIAMATRLVRDKGAGIAVAAARLLRERGVPFRFRLAGAIDDGNPDAHTRAEVQAWVADGLVEWEGFVSDIPGFWAGCDIAVYPSTYGEGVPKTLMEAAACGRPAVTTDWPGCRDAVEDGRTGFLVPPQDVAATADRLARLLTDPALRRRMGQAARIKAETEFADAVVIPKTLAVYAMPLAGLR